MERFVIWGPLGCFARPESPDRFSYILPPGSAARAMAKHIYSHPGIYHDVRRVSLLNPPRYLRLGFGYASDFVSKIEASKGKLVPDKRPSVEVLLRDPKFLIEFEWKLVPGAKGPFAPKKWSAIFQRRLKNGEFYYPPCLGRTEFGAYVEPATGKEKPIDITRDLGVMIHDIDYRTKPPMAYSIPVMLKRGVAHYPSFFDRVLAKKEAA